MGCFTRPIQVGGSHHITSLCINRRFLDDAGRRAGRLTRLNLAHRHPRPRSPLSVTLTTFHGLRMTSVSDYWTWNSRFASQQTTPLRPPKDVAHPVRSLNLLFAWHTCKEQGISILEFCFCSPMPKERKESQKITKKRVLGLMDLMELLVLVGSSGRVDGCTAVVHHVHHELHLCK